MAYLKNREWGVQALGTVFQAVEPSHSSARVYEFVHMAPSLKGLNLSFHFLLL